MRLAGTVELTHSTVREGANCAAPERERRSVALRYAHGPHAGETTPQKKRRLTTNTGPSMSPKHEELSDVENVWVLDYR
jgi:hypothetical protein